MYLQKEQNDTELERILNKYEGMKNIKAFFKKAKKENAYIFPRLFQFIFQKPRF